MVRNHQLSHWQFEWSMVDLKDIVFSSSPGSDVAFDERWIVEGTSLPWDDGKDAGMTVNLFAVFIKLLK